MKPMTTGLLKITCAAKRPDLVPVVSRWLWREWWQDRGLSADQARIMHSEGQVEIGAPQMLILLADDVPVGTASLVPHDLEERPDLSPWLAAVFVIPEMRGRGHAYRLLEAFDEACRAAGVETAWLYTRSAEGLYLKAGWRVAQIVERLDKPPVTLMRREFISQHANAALTDTRPDRYPT